MNASFRLLAVLLLGVATGESATITWTNTAGGKWSVAANWNPNQVPTNADTALITTPGTYTVSLDFNANPSSFHPTVTLGAGGGAAGGQTLALTNCTFSFTNLVVTNGGVVACSNSVFIGALLVANGGIFNGQGNDWFSLSATVARGGILNEVTVNIPQGATLTVAGGGTMNLAAAVGDYGVLNGSLVNAGTLNFTNGGFYLAYQMLGLWSGGLLNQPGGQLNLNGSVSLEENGYVSGGLSTLDTTYFTNRGALTQVAGTNVVTVGAVNNSQGTITNLSGSLALGTVATNLAGVFSAAPGAVIQLDAINDGYTVTTPGSPLVIGGGGTVQFLGGILYYASNTVPNLDLHSGLLILGPNFQGGSVTNLTLHGIELTNSVTVTGRLNATNGYVFGNISVAGGGVFFATNVVNLGPLTLATGGSAMVGGCNFVGPVNVAAGAGLTLGGTCELNAGLTNSGAVNLIGLTLVIINNPAYADLGGIQNQPGGMINLTGTGTSVFYAYGPEYFQNRGAITQNSPGGTNSITMPNFVTAQGAITNLAGTLVLAAFQTNLAGAFDTAPGAVTQISGGGLTGVVSPLVNPPLAPGAPLTFAGGGQVQFIGSYRLGQYQFTGGYLLFPSDTVPKLALAGGTLALGPSFQGGAITNLTLDGMTLTNSLPITGIFTATNGSSVFGDFTVAGGGVFNCAANLYGSVTVANGGLLSVSNGPGTTPGPVLGATVTSSGALTVDHGGQLNVVGGGLNLYGPLTNAGLVTIANPHPFTITISNVVYNIPAGVNIYNNPAYGAYGGVWNQASGQINLATDYTLVNGSYAYETLVNQGGITKSAGTNYAYLYVPFTTNSGAITVQSGTIRMRPLTTLPGGSLNVGLNSADNYGSFAFGTNVLLGGAFNATLNGGYVPANGATFNVLQSFTGVSGTFSSLGLPSAVSWQALYGSTNFTLAVGAAKPQFAAVNFLGTNLIFSAFGGTPTSNSLLLMSTNLALPVANWTPIGTNRFDANGQVRYTNRVNPAKPRQFFIFKIP